MPVSVDARSGENRIRDALDTPSKDGRGLKRSAHGVRRVCDCPRHELPPPAAAACAAAAAGCPAAAAGRAVGGVGSAAASGGVAAPGGVPGRRRCCAAARGGGRRGSCGCCCCGGGAPADTGGAALVAAEGGGEESRQTLSGAAPPAAACHGHRIRLLLLLFTHRRLRRSHVSTTPRFALRLSLGSRVAAAASVDASTAFHVLRQNHVSQIQEVPVPRQPASLPLRWWQPETRHGRHEK